MALDTVENVVPIRTTKASRSSGGTAPFLLNLDIRDVLSAFVGGGGPHEGCAPVRIE